MAHKLAIFVTPYMSEVDEYGQKFMRPIYGTDEDIKVLIEFEKSFSSNAECLNYLGEKMNKIEEILNE
jgi:hypothetical protein